MYIYYSNLNIYIYALKIIQIKRKIYFIYIYMSLMQLISYVYNKQKSFK